MTKKPVPDAVRKAIPGRDFVFGRNYIIPTPFDPRLITELPVEIAKAAMASGVATNYIYDFEKYRKELLARVAPKKCTRPTNY
jgi:malate dehydrogenase (oxaloacetate-decarboxylating)(NADP+)|tara:strand:+ start:834 stop:1082 length:249 start_codon:yes stop_codon:yes gene_type:complete